MPNVKLSMWCKYADAAKFSLTFLSLSLPQCTTSIYKHNYHYVMYILIMFYIQNNIYTKYSKLRMTRAVSGFIYPRFLILAHVTCVFHLKRCTLTGLEI
jgi:hypothetical protein